MEDSDHILHHTVSGGEDTRSKQRKKGITWPVRHLAREIGPRPPGSKAERSAARFIEKELKALGLEVETQRFRTPVTTAWSEMLVHLLMVIGVLVFHASSHLGYGLIFLGFIFFLLESYGRSPFSWLQPHPRSENVITRINPQRGQERTVVLVAHMDSPRTAFYYHPGLIHFVRFFYLLDFACVAALFMLFTVSYGGFLLSMEQDVLDLLWHLGLIIAIPPALSVIALLFKAAAGRSIPGGNSNASGVSVLLELARVYTRRQPRHVDIWLVSTGAADADATGVRRFARSYRRDLKGAYFVLLDGVGRGFPICYKREGRLLSFRANRKLSGLAKRISETQTHYSAGFRRNSLYLSEGFHLLSRGRKAITVSSRDESHYPRFWRWSKDDYDNVDPRSLRLSLDFVIAIVDGIDRGDLKKTTGP
ncbi:MAG: M28 family peptidase [Actinobacteria bacterium]|nr:M28 family peptidase [Actinomycetota bacterium]